MLHAELIERLEKLTGPCRKVDLEILARVDQAGQWSENDIAYALSDVEGTTAPPAFTNSLDAAVALGERLHPGQVWHLMTAALKDWSISDGKTPDLPRFYLIATLRAQEDR